MFKLGQRLRDKVTGYQGIATIESKHLNGCIRYCLEAPATDGGKVPKEQWVDDQQLELVDQGILDQAKKPVAAVGGPPRHTPPRGLER